MDGVRRRIQVIKLGQRVDNILKLSLISCSKPERMIKNDLAAKIRSLDIFLCLQVGSKYGERRAMEFGNQEGFNNLKRLLSSYKEKKDYIL